jgi:hypothetical protein
VVERKGYKMKQIKLEVPCNFNAIQNHVRAFFYEKFNRLIWFNIIEVTFKVISSDNDCIHLSRYDVLVDYDEDRNDYLGFVYRAEEVK